MQVGRNRIDNQTLQQARTQANALGRLYEHFHPRIYRYCHHRLLCRTRAEDASSRVFLKVAAAIGRFRGRSLEQFAAWLYRIASNEINNDLRTASRRRRSLEAAARLSAAGPEPDRQGQTDFAIVQRHLLKMSTTDQTYIALRYFENMSPSEIGRIMQRSPQAARTGLCRAVQRLRRRVLASAAPDQGR